MRVGRSCGSRRATRCPACAATYRADARALILAGLAGGKGIADTVTDHPAVFVTLTAPSFGAVHLAATDRPCHRAPAGRCPHDRRLACRARHSADDDRVGSPICPDCHDYVGAVIWNAMVTTLWQRTAVALRRSVAALLDSPVRHLASHLRVSFAKVVEYQRRGVIHLHGAIRLDGPDGTPPALADSATLATAVRLAAGRAWAPNPLTGAQPIVWGDQLEVTPINTENRRQLASYLAKYATKSTDDAGVLDRRLHHAPPDHVPLPDHLRRLVLTAWELAERPVLADVNLRDWVHTLGDSGHWLTKSRNWSTTLTALRADRQTWRIDHDPDATPPDPEDITVGEWTYCGSGYQTAGDAWLAASMATARAINRRTAWEEAP